MPGPASERELGAPTQQHPKKLCTHQYTATVQRPHCKYTRAPHTTLIFLTALLSIMPRGREPTSETETKQPVSRSANKARSQAAQSAQQEFLARHINSNGPQDKPKVHPLDFSSLPDKAIRSYMTKHSLQYPEPSSLNADILNLHIGKKTHSYKKSLQTLMPKRELAEKMRDHFLALPFRENEIITNFLYKVKNQDRDFKLTF